MMDPAFASMDADQRNRYLADLLTTKVVEISFTKVNGEARTMPCTLHPDVLPKPALAEHHRTTLYNPEVIRVWCMDKNAWRSFRVMSVTDIKIR